jgi:hypothetical protein
MYQYNLSKEEYQIFRTILFSYGSVISSKSHLVRSPKLILEEVIKDFPDHIQGLATQVFFRMVCEFYFFIEEPGITGTKRYSVNPNKAEVIRKLLFNRPVPK